MSSMYEDYKPEWKQKGIRSPGRIGSIRLFFRYLTLLFKAQMQYKTSFWLLSAGQFLVPFTAFAGVYFLFERFGTIQGWTFYEVALCFAVIHMSFAISECLARGFDSFSGFVVQGEFDRVLVRPRGTIVQVLGSKFEFTRFGRLMQSVMVLVLAISGGAVEWSLLKILTLLLMIVSGICVFAGIFMLAATICFWTVQGLEFVNIFTDGGREMAQYPLGIYPKWVLRFFTFVIPFGAVNYYPLLYILDRTEGSAFPYVLLPLAGIAFLIPSLLVWRMGVRHYHSTGS